ncbi:transposase [Actinoplanes cyaneus]|uniref:transposase n=1 Tax=Actinoplanes cyaneus TaxID=52696 RepID=UPI0019430A82
MHGRYSRELRDVPIAGVATRIQLQVRRFICGNAACIPRTFVEQVDGVTCRRVRSTDGLRRTLTAIALALVRRAGARLGAVLGMVTSRSSLLRLIRALPDPPERPVTVLGVDDFAIKEGQNYGTVLIDCEDGRVVDLLPGRDAAPLAGWLDAHSKPDVICSQHHLPIRACRHLARDDRRAEATSEQPRPVQATPPAAHRRGLPQSRHLAPRNRRAGLHRQVRHRPRRRRAAPHPPGPEQDDQASIGSGSHRLDLPPP